ncbi:unnamed protein product [Cylindrotheca closterium]|uniref:Uncharacterized protein n=1 Tax=Cylindrotheca closterium TaxID=2856 RepID=A0AAD2CHW8_9STRA|nr:unnamed protein product [Cylindrotheca closterium]
MFHRIFSPQCQLILLISLTSVIFASCQQCEPCTRNDAGEVEEPGHGGSGAFNCDIAAIEAQSFDNGTAACRDHQLMMWQRNCCPDPPSNHCSMCDTYNGDKVVPRFEHQQFGSPDINFTCSNVAERITYLDRDGIFSEYGNCDHTERGRARAWCECEGTFPDCTLKCPDGSDIPDPNKADPLFGETCARWMFETTTLPQEGCENIEDSLFFSAISFCCNLPPPKTCSICPEGEELTNSTEEVFRGKTCAEVQEYADWLPDDSCTGWFSRLMDDPFDPTAKCCVVSLNSGGGATDDTTTATSEARGGATLGLAFTLLLLILPHVVVQ